MIFSKKGFTENLINFAKNNSTVMLFSLDMLEKMDG